MVGAGSGGGGGPLSGVCWCGGMEWTTCGVQRRRGSPIDRAVTNTGLPDTIVNVMHVFVVCVCVCACVRACVRACARERARVFYSFLAFRGFFWGFFHVLFYFCFFFFFSFFFSFFLFFAAACSFVIFETVLLLIVLFTFCGKFVLQLHFVC